jgi:hypothetical protein
MICENVLCIYNKKEKCILSEISLDYQGRCSECIYVSIEETQLKPKYNKAMEYYQNAESVQAFGMAIELFEQISDYRDSKIKADECKDAIYQQALNEIKKKNYEAALEGLQIISNWKDSQKLINECAVKSPLSDDEKRELKVALFIIGAIIAIGFLGILLK